MKRYLFATVAVVAVIAVTLCLNAQPAGGPGGGGFGGGGFGGGGGGGFGGGGRGGGMMGGMMGGMSTERPDKAARLNTVKELETQIATLKAAIEKAPAKDPNFTTLSEEDRTKAMEWYQPESDAVSAIQASLRTLSGGGMMGGGSVGELSSLRVLAKDEKATKTVSKLDELIKEAATNPMAGMRGRGNRGGGMMGGGGFGGGGFGGGQG